MYFDLILVGAATLKLSWPPFQRALAVGGAFDNYILIKALDPISTVLLGTGRWPPPADKLAPGLRPRPAKKSTSPRV